MNPLFSWAGGKRRVANEIIKHLPIWKLHEGSAYFEPFCGGAAVFFKIEPFHAFLFDINEELIRTYKGIQQEPYLVADVLHDYLRSDDKKVTANELKKLHPKDLEDHEVAARMMYLIKCSFGSLYRVNKDGYFNVPIHKYPKNMVETHSLENLLEWSKLLKRAVLMCTDFSKVLDYVKENDVVYFDPPYHKEEAFYDFPFEEHVRLSKVARRCRSIGAHVGISLGESNEAVSLYDDFTKIDVAVYQALAKNPKHRRYRQEYLVVG